ncbi:MAG: hypothetical protein ACE5JI_18475, partial [Acidobacteriota bacterium]
RSATPHRRGSAVIKSDKELRVTMNRIASFQEQVAYLRQRETNPENYRMAVSGYLAEIDRMNLEIRRRPRRVLLVWTLSLLASVVAG